MAPQSAYEDFTGMGRGALADYLAIRSYHVPAILA